MGAGSALGLATGLGEGLAVDAGVDVGLPYVGLAPDIGYWEFGMPSVIRPPREGTGSVRSCRF